MVTSDFSISENAILSANRPMDLFGDNEKRARNTYLKLMASVHPDNNADVEGRATAATQRLTELWCAYSKPDSASSGRVPSEVTRNKRYAILEDGGMWLVVERATCDKMPTYGVPSDLSSITEGSPVVALDPQNASVISQRDGGHAAYRCKVSDPMTKGRGMIPLTEIGSHLPGGMWHPRDLAWVSKRILFLDGAMKRTKYFDGDPCEYLGLCPDSHLLVIVAPWAMKQDTGESVIASFLRLIDGRVGPDDASQRIFRFLSGASKVRNMSACEVLNEFDSLLYTLFGEPAWHDMETA